MGKLRSRFKSGQRPPGTHWSLRQVGVDAGHGQSGPQGATEEKEERAGHPDLGRQLDTLDSSVMTKATAKLQRRYYNPRLPGSFGGVTALKRATKQKPARVREWLSGQDTYTLHKPVRRNFRRRRIIVGGMNHQWQADLIDLQKLKNYID